MPKQSLYGQRGNSYDMKVAGLKSPRGQSVGTHEARIQRGTRNPLDRKYGKYLKRYVVRA